MIGTLLKRHLRHHRLLIICLLSAMVGFELLIITIGNAIDQVQGFEELLQSLPKFLKDLIRTQIGTVSFPTFAAVGFEHPATMGGGLAYVIYICTIPAGERDIGFADLLLARPITRGQYLGATMIHLNLTALAIPAFLLIGTILGLAFADSPKALPWTDYLPAAVGLWTLLLAWGGITMFIASGSQRRGAAVIQVVAALVTTFLLHVVGQFASAMNWIVWISPFHYFNPIGSVMLSKDWHWDVVTLLLIGALTAAAAFRRFNTRDI